MHVCQFCCKPLSSTQSQERHELKCQGISNSLMCSMCTRILSTRQAKYRHVKQCIKQISAPHVIEKPVHELESETLDHINIADYVNLGFYQLVKDIHFNPNVPMNHNIRLRTINIDRQVYTREGGRWIVRAFCDIIEWFDTKYKWMLFSYIGSLEDGVVKQIEFLEKNRKSITNKQLTELTRSLEVPESSHAQSESIVSGSD